MKFVFAFATVVLLSAPAAAEYRTPDQRPPCVSAYWLRAAGMLVGLNLPVGTVCPNPALGDPPEGFKDGTPGAPREPEEPPCHEWNGGK